MSALAIMGYALGAIAVSALILGIVCAWSSYEGPPEDDVDYDGAP